VKCVVFNVTTVGVLTETVLAAVLVTIQERIVKCVARHVRMVLLMRTGVRVTARVLTTAETVVKCATLCAPTEALAPGSVAVIVRLTSQENSVKSAASNVRMEVKLTKRLVPVNALGSIQEVIVKSVR
jgi:hypothetical protein